jgi:hypothetical protein|tara:strand:+ start:110 stop:556 length:447 start_codon:yes stop_codon:yes gene_type:complete
MDEEEKQRLANELRRKAIREDMLDQALGDRPEFGSFQDATRSLIDSDYNPEGTVLSRAMGITQQPAQPNMNPTFTGGYEQRDMGISTVPEVGTNPFRDKLNEMGMSQDSMPLPSGVDIISDPIKSKNILVNRLKELPLDVLAKMLGIR